MFIVVGVVGAVLFLWSLLVGDFLTDLVPDVESFSGAVIGAGFAGFGLLGWFVGAVLDAPGPFALIAAIGGGLLLGAATERVAGEPADATGDAAGLVGASGRVVTAIGTHAPGEVVVQRAGAPTTYLATADSELERGASVVIVGVETPTTLRVRAAGPDDVGA